MEGDQPARPVRTTLDPERYHDFRIIGAGGMGVVFLAFDRELNRSVAVKVVRPRGGADTEGDAATPFEITPPSNSSSAASSYGAVCDRFLQEAWLTGGLEHPGIVPVYELGRTARGVPYYTMRYVKGVRTFEDALSSAGSLSERLDLLDAFLAVCDTLAYAHSRGVIHRDLKPANIGLGEFGEVVLLDWGLAKMRDAAEAVESVWAERIREFRDVRDLRTVAGAMGTPGYMSPEAAFGDLERVDERSDVYGLGAILYGILTGALPFEFESYSELLHQLREKTPRPAVSVDPAVPEGLSEIASQALQTDRDDRFAGAGELAAAIRKDLRETGIRDEIRALMTQAEEAFDAGETSTGDARFQQLDRVRAFCLRVLAVRPDHIRARRLLARSDTLRQQAEAEREEALTEEAEQAGLALIRETRRRHGKQIRRVAAAFLLVLALGAAIAAVYFHRQRGEAQGRAAALRALLGRVGVVEENLEQAKAGVLAEKAAAEEAHAELTRLEAKVRAASDETRAAVLERDTHRASLESEARQREKEMRDVRAEAAARAAKALEGEFAEELKQAETDYQRQKAALALTEEVAKTAEKRKTELTADLTVKMTELAQAKLDREAVFLRASEAEDVSLAPVRALARVGALHGDDKLMALVHARGDPRDPQSLALRLSAVKALGMRLTGRQAGSLLIAGLSEFEDEPAILAEIIRSLGRAATGADAIRRLLDRKPRDVEVAREAVRAIARTALSSTVARDYLLAQLRQDPTDDVHGAVMEDVLTGLRNSTGLPFRERETWLRWDSHRGGKSVGTGFGRGDNDPWRYRLRNHDPERWRFQMEAGWLALGIPAAWPWRQDQSGFCLRRAEQSLLARPGAAPLPTVRFSGDWAFVDVGGLSARETYPPEEDEKPHARRSRCVDSLAATVREKLETLIPAPESVAFDKRVTFAGEPAVRHSIRGSPDGGPTVILQMTVIEHNELLYVVTAAYGASASRHTLLQLQKILRTFEFLDE